MTQRNLRRPAGLVALLTALLLVVAACGGGAAGSKAATLSPSQRLAAAKKAFDATQGVTIDLQATNLPKSVSGVLSATGVGNHQPAFKGAIKVFQNGLSINVPIVAVDKVVYVQLGTWQQIDPKAYNAPDPAALMDPSTGLSTLLTRATKLSAGQEKRQGSDKVTAITATVPGAAVAHIIPSAAADKDFAATMTLNADNQLTKVVLTGQFYPQAGGVTYTFTFSNYGTSETIKAP